jgi:hypothetical protein
MFWQGRIEGRKNTQGGFMIQFWSQNWFSVLIMVTVIIVPCWAFEKLEEKVK